MTTEPSDSWLEERLFDRRIVLCRGILDDALAGRVSAQLMALDALGDGAIALQLDSQGASLEAAWTLLDVIDLLGVPVNIVCAGRVEGSAVGVLSAGTKRTALAHTRFRLTDPELEISGRTSELGALLDHHNRASRPVARAGRLVHRPSRLRSCSRLPRRALARRGRGAALPARRRHRRGRAAHPIDRQHSPALGPRQEARHQRAARLQTEAEAPVRTLPSEP